MRKKLWALLIISSSKISIGSTPPPVIARNKSVETIRLDASPPQLLHYSQATVHAKGPSTSPSPTGNPRSHSPLSYYIRKAKGDEKN